MTITYRPKGVCSRLMRVEVEDGIIRQVEVQGGCSGNLQGISRLLVGMPVQQAIERMEGVNFLRTCIFLFSSLCVESLDLVKVDNTIYCVE